jgi:hypothetical protein
VHPSSQPTKIAQKTEMDPLLKMEMEKKKKKLSEDKRK